MMRLFKKQNSDLQLERMLAKHIALTESTTSDAPCGQDLAMAMAFVEGCLTGYEREKFQNHLIDCRHCRLFVASEIRASRGLAADSVIDNGPSRRSWLNHLGQTELVAIFLSVLRNPAILGGTVAAAFILVAMLFIVRNTNGPATVARQPSITSEAKSLPVIPAPGLVAVVPTIPVQPARPTRIAVQPVAEDTIRVERYFAQVSNSSISGVSTRNRATLSIDGTTATGQYDSISEVIGVTAQPEIQNPGATGVSEYSIELHPLNLPAPAPPPVQAGADKPLTQSQLSQVSSERLTQPGVEIPNYNPAADPMADKDSSHTEIVIISRPQLPGFQARDEAFLDKRTASRSRDQTPTISIAGKQFTLSERVWIDNDFNISSGLPIVKLKVNSPELKQLLSEQPALQKFFHLGRQVIVVYEGKIYLTY